MKIALLTRRRSPCPCVDGGGGAGNSLGEYPIEEVFSDLCNEPLGEDFINDLAEKKDFCDEYVNYSCGGSCDELDYYLDAWKYIIDHIISGQITESTLDSWLEYFDECYYQEETTVEK